MTDIDIGSRRREAKAVCSHDLHRYMAQVLLCASVGMHNECSASCMDLCASVVP